MTPHSLTKFEIQKYCQNECKFKGAYSINNLWIMNMNTFVLDLLLFCKKVKVRLCQFIFSYQIWK